MRVEKLYREAKSAIDALNQAGLLAEALIVGETARKTLAIAAASAFETDVIQLILGFSNATTGGNPYCSALIKQRVLDRQFHTLFSWKETSAGSFFAIFGADAKRYYDEAVRASVSLGQSARDFLDLGNARNEIVHKDYATYVFDKSLDDVIAQYRSARVFVDFIGVFLDVAARNALP
jgi:hypothetical protein